MRSKLHNRQPRSTRLAIGAVALLMLTSAACVKQNQPGVGIVKFDSSAVFGVATKAPELPGFDLPDNFAEIPDLPDLVPHIGDIAKGPCPNAKLTAFPKASATPKVIGMPTEGVYRWKRDSYTVKNAALTPPLRALPFGLENRAIRRVTRLSDHKFSFDMVQPDPFNATATLITSFIVNSNPKLLVNQRVQSRTIGVVPIPGQDVRIADPTDMPGIFISRAETQDAQGARISLFEPVLPMMIAPLEEGILRSGETFRSVGIDATNTAAIVNDGVVGRTSRVDACGEIVEGYAITLHQIATTDIDPSDPNSIEQAVLNSETRSVDYVFATQYGALPIAENIALGDVLSPASPVALSAKYELGGLVPTPLPDSLK